METPLSTDTEFWKYMVEAGVLDRALADEFRDRARDIWMPLGQVLLRRGILDVGQVSDLLAMQAHEPDMRVGDLAVREGMCTGEEIASCLSEQREVSPHPIEMLLADDRVDTGMFFGPLIEYVRWLEGRLYALMRPSENG